MKDKTFLVTGGTTGIGLATARLLASGGARVIVTGRNPETLAAAKAELPSGAVILKSDSGSLADARGLAAAVRPHAERLDGIFLNAGIAPFAPFEAQTPESFDALFAVNVRGPYFQLQSLLGLLANPASVVLTASIAGSGAFAGTSVYSATKAAVISLGKNLAVELAPRGVRVNVLSPGPIETPIFQKTGLPAEVLQGFAESITTKSLLKRIGTPDEVATLARFLLSEEAGYVTGAEFIVDGGVRLN